MVKKLYIEYFRTPNYPDKNSLLKIEDKLRDEGVISESVFNVIETNQQPKVSFYEAVSALRQVEFDDGSIGEEIFISKGKLLDQIDCNFDLKDIENKIRTIEPSSPKLSIFYFLPTKYNWECWLRKNWWVILLLLLLIAASIYYFKFYKK